MQLPKQPKKIFTFYNPCEQCALEVLKINPVHSVSEGECIDRLEPGMTQKMDMTVTGKIFISNSIINFKK